MSRSQREEESGVCMDGPEYACVRGEACDRDADVVIDAEHLLLVRGELSARALDNAQERERAEEP